MKGKEKQRIVVKIGASTLTDNRCCIDHAFMERFTEDVASVHRQGKDVVLVTSGAVRTGIERMGLRDNLNVQQKQAAAAVGQGLLVQEYTMLFGRHNIIIAQVLITRDIVHFRNKYLNARNTLLTLLQYRIIPVVNENDTVAYEGIMFGGNDPLSAVTAVIVDADLLVVLTDVDGLYDTNPKKTKDAKIIPVVEQITDEIQGFAQGPIAGGGLGGMTTKVAAAKTATEAGIKTVIANGREKNVVQRIISGEALGTIFLPQESTLTSRKKWIACGPTPEGKIIVNEGAREMILHSGKSLLPSGIVRVEGEFDNGACVEIADESDKTFARGLTNYSAVEIDKIRGKHTREIKKVLGYNLGSEVIHRDNLTLQ
ncbi:MAG: glutamate 5-kinase [bacterium]